jgi:hypothetical protein
VSLVHIFKSETRLAKSQMKENVHSRELIEYKITNVNSFRSMTVSDTCLIYICTKFQHNDHWQKMMVGIVNGGSGSDSLRKKETQRCQIWCFYIKSQMKENVHSRELIEYKITNVNSFRSMTVSDTCLIYICTRFKFLGQSLVVKILLLLTFDLFAF